MQTGTHGESSNPPILEPLFQISDNAAKRISFLAAQEPSPNAKLRIAVDGGGCSGFQYRYEFTTTANEDDHAFSNGAATVLVDDMSLQYLSGSMVDYVETMAAAHFEIRNPNASANCGCGNSFAV
jgi:iron-sulfur cluster insertion protein